LNLQHPIVLSLVSAYLLGSIPFGYLLVRAVHGADVRQSGSGNIGATNVSRTSPVLGVLTLLLDASKGFAAVALVIFGLHAGKGLAFAAAVAAICGHIFPVWLGFRGGKGVATGFGSLLLLTPKAVLFAIAIFLAFLAAFRWVALSSVAASASMPVLAWALKETRPGVPSGHLEHLPTVIWIIAAAILIIGKHHANMRRMLAGTEPKFRVRKSG
jgi:acyl phosphate:glycerol-3-phosphate acyltransferase